MTYEKLEKGNQIKEEIESLNDFLNESDGLSELSKAITTCDPVSINIATDSETGDEYYYFFHPILNMHIKHFINICKGEIENEIKRLEHEFKNL